MPRSRHSLGSPSPFSVTVLWGVSSRVELHPGDFSKRIKIHEKVSTAGSPTVTLFRLKPSLPRILGGLPRRGAPLGSCGIPGPDEQFVQMGICDSPPPSERRLLAIPSSSSSLQGTFRGRVYATSPFVAHRTPISNQTMSACPRSQGSLSRPMGPFSRGLRPQPRFLPGTEIQCAVGRGTGEGEMDSAPSPWNTPFSPCLPEGNKFPPERGEKPLDPPPWGRTPPGAPSTLRGESPTIPPPPETEGERLNPGVLPSSPWLGKILMGEGPV